MGVITKAALKRKSGKTFEFTRIPDLAQAFGKRHRHGGKANEIKYTRPGLTERSKGRKIEVELGTVICLGLGLPAG
jgi:hypothetical protein